MSRPRTKVPEPGSRLRTIIAGSRHCVDLEAVREAVKSCGWYPSVVLSGGARGADTMGEVWAAENDVPVEIYPANWEKYGTAAGFQRNVRMAEEAEALIALWNRRTPGTRHMVHAMKSRLLPVFVYEIE